MKPHQISILYHIAKIAQDKRGGVRVNMLPKRRRRSINQIPPSTITIAEVGVRCGESSAILLENFPQLNMLLIDNWPKGQNHAGQNYQDDYDLMLKRTDFAKNRITIIHENSVQAANKIEDNSLDLCFIDADHSYKAVKQDIAAYLPKVKKGGYLGGHDFIKDRRYGVIQAVQESGLDFYTDIGTNWWVKV